MTFSMYFHLIRHMLRACVWNTLLGSAFGYTRLKPQSTKYHHASWLGIMLLFLTGWLMLPLKSIFGEYPTLFSLVTFIPCGAFFFMIVSLYANANDRFKPSRIDLLYFSWEWLFLLLMGFVHSYTQSPLMAWATFVTGALFMVLIPFAYACYQTLGTSRYRARTVLHMLMEYAYAQDHDLFGSTEDKDHVLLGVYPIMPMGLRPFSILLHTEETWKLALDEVYREAQEKNNPNNPVPENTLKACIQSLRELYKHQDWCAVHYTCAQASTAWGLYRQFPEFSTNVRSEDALSTEGLVL